MAALQLLPAVLQVRALMTCFVGCHGKEILRLGGESAGRETAEYIPVDRGSPRLIAEAEQGLSLTYQELRQELE